MVRVVRATNEQMIRPTDPTKLEPATSILLVACDVIAIYRWAPFLGALRAILELSLSAHLVQVLLALLVLRQLLNLLLEQILLDDQAVRGSSLDPLLLKRRRNQMMAQFHRNDAMHLPWQHGMCSSGDTSVKWLCINAARQSAHKKCPSALHSAPLSHAYLPPHTPSHCR